MTSLKKYFGIIIISLIILSLDYNSNNNFSFPIQGDYYISSYFGYRTLNGNYHFHNGIDIPKPKGTSVYAISSGIVISTSFSSSYGNNIVILHDNGYKSLYGHLDENITLNKGDNVLKNQIIGYIGGKYLKNGRLNGYTTGCHLHFTVYKDNKAINPLTLIYEKK